MFNRSQIQSDLAALLGIVTALVVIGLLFVYSSSSIYAAQNYGYAHYFLKKQCIGVVLGLIAFFVARRLSSEIIYSMTPAFFLGSLALTIATLFPQLSHHIHGSSRWLAFKGFSFQPSELLKIACIMYLARILSKQHKESFTRFSGYIPFLIIIGLVTIVLLKQPDFGLAMTLLATSITLLFIAGLPVLHLLCAGMGLVTLIGLLIYAQPYRMRRILTFLDPWKDPQGAGFQIIQSLIAVGSGGWWGSGISNSKQKFFYLPMQHTDFIFSIITEETGFIGGSLIILLYALFTYFGIKIAWQLKNPFAILTTIGFVTLTSLQALINIFVVTGLLPTKGIGLPFISYGNSSLLCFLGMMGIIAHFADKDGT